jgi:hypothetical protein
LILMTVANSDKPSMLTRNEPYERDVTFVLSN